MVHGTVEDSGFVVMFFSLTVEGGSRRKLFRRFFHQTGLTLLTPLQAPHER